MSILVVRTAALLAVLCACGAAPVATPLPAVPRPVASTQVAPTALATAQASAASAPPPAPSPTGPELAVQLHDGIVQVRGQGFEPGERIAVSLDEHDAEGYGSCHGDPLPVTANPRGVFRARLHVPPCGALLCARHALGVSADWACGSDCRRGLVTPACPDVGAAKRE